MVVASSGKEVPRPMMVAPIMDAGRPMKSAMSTELSTANLERIIINRTPTKNLMHTTTMFPSCLGVSSKVAVALLLEMVTLK